MRRIAFLFLLCFVLARADGAEPPARTFVVFFQEWSARLDNAALAVIGQAGAYAKAHPGVAVHVEGFADPTGSRKANALLTDLRAQVVMDRLQADGVPVPRMRGRGRGSVHFALSSQQSRRVEISLGSH
ncbi:MAG TPA: OmpA family protein [Acetobacteraceae bacterium]|nr:OmpA family protein [Acetobacteraceae bacterium]